MKLFHNAKSSASGLALVALVTVSTGFLETTPAFAKAPAKAQPAVLTASAIAVADKYSADAAEQ
ncbi:MAG: gamma-glutamyltranspeptidase / glutathione hydrolase, partial [Paraburkholderia sp.]|nr:gamma-glutamyltranspeptidase / glutathione hydrolase [Paraburkholderia sp.]